jgi:hypothetical protein
VPFATGPLGYDPLKASGYDKIKASSLGPNPSEEAELATNGFVITDRVKAPSFVYGYETIYMHDLPVYVSADSILYAVHKSFDAILMQVESSSLIPTLTRMLAAMRAASTSGAAADLPAAARGDVDTYLAVAESLLGGEAVNDDPTVASLVRSATSAQGTGSVNLFGVGREIDFSQFAPRGHYADTPQLSQYFRAQMWLGRIDFRFIETGSGGQTFHRRQVEGAYVLRALMSSASMADWRTIDDMISGFVGEHDSMTVPQLDSLLADLKLAKAADLANLTDAQIAQAIVAGAYGHQRVASDLIEGGLGSATTPLASAFTFLGQRYTVDSYVFANLVWDRVGGGKVMRMMPNPLDVGFAALGNNHAGTLLKDELAKYPYAADLASMRVLVEAHPTEYWDSSLYTDWLSMLRTLSSAPDAPGIPHIAATEPWARRILQTQLASWAELRHDTLLYAKQSYGAGASCEYPDAYIDPYPDLFARLGSFAAKGAALTTNVPPPPISDSYYVSPSAYFQQLASVAATLQAMAQNQRAGAPHTAEQMQFINTLTFQQGCGGVIDGFDGWYAKLFYSPGNSINFDPIVADVHTQPTDETGNPVGRILHVGTATPRTMIVTVESCNGPHAYAGIVSSYREQITQNYQRLDDQTWWSQLNTAPPPEVPWLADLVAH